MYGKAIQEHANGVTGWHTGVGVGVYGYSEAGKAGYFHGSVDVVGTPTKTAGSFKIDHPLDPGEGKLPLLPGAFVDVDLSGRDVAQVATIPRVALHGDSLWLVEGSRLEPRQVQVAWSTRDDAFVTQGLQTGDQVLLTPISLPIRGMKVRVQPRAASPANGQASLEQGGGDE